MEKTIRYTAALVLAAFGLLTLFLSSSVIFDLFGIRAKQGNYVLFILWANFVCSLMYLGAVFGFLKKRKWTTPLLAISLVILIFAFIGLQFHIHAGRLYETKTVYAMIFRMSVTTVFTLVSYFFVTKKT